MIDPNEVETVVPFGKKDLTDRDIASNLEITLDGRTFQMNDFMRSLASQTLVSLDGSGVLSVQWKLSDGSIDTVLLTDLREVLKLATEQVRAFWAN